MHEAILLTRVASKNFKKLKSSFELFFARVYLEIPVIILIVKHLRFFVDLVFNIGTLEIFFSLEDFGC